MELECGCGETVKLRYAHTVTPWVNAPRLTSRHGCAGSRSASEPGDGAGRASLDGSRKRLLSAPMMSIMATVVSKYPRRDTTSTELTRVQNYCTATTGMLVFMGTP